VSRARGFAGSVVLAAGLASSLPGSARAESSLVVRGDAACPSVDMIRSALLAARPDGGLPEQPVAVDVTGDRLTVTLGDAPSARREIPADRDCAVRAASVAMVIVAWSGDLRSETVAPPVLIATSPPAVLAATARPPTRATHVIEVDGSAFYSPVWGHAPGAWLGVGRAPRAGRVGVRLQGGYQTARAVTLEAGTNEIQRFLLGAAASYQLQRARLFAGGEAGLVGTVTHAQGAGYETNRAASTANFGGLVELRGGVRWGRARLWAGARGLRLAFAENVKIQSSSPGVNDSATLSPWDLQLGAGLGWVFE
jgi:hypothetical protein